MEPGRELDALIAEKIFGLKVQGAIGSHELPGGEGTDMAIIGPFAIIPEYGPVLVKNYSTKIEDVWEVVEKLRHLHPHVAYNDTETIWRAEFVNVDRDTASVSDTAPHAICLAALKTLG